MFLCAIALLIWQIENKDGFNVIWKYFGWANQTLAVFMLWTATAYLVKFMKGLTYLITMIPAAFMTAVCTTYICVAKIGLGLPDSWNRAIGLATFVVSLVVFYILYFRRRK